MLDLASASQLTLMMPRLKQVNIYSPGATCTISVDALRSLVDCPACETYT